MSLRRKLAIATWDGPREGNIYGKMTLDVTEVQRYIDHLRKTTGEKVTVTHMVGKAVGAALKEEPSLNGRILFRRFVPFETVDIAFLVALEEGDDLAQVKIENVDEKPTAELAAELRESATRLRKGKDEGYESSKGLLKLMPRWLLPKFLNAVGWLTSALGVRIPGSGQDKFPFGSAVITSVGMFGIDEGYAPPTPFARVPIYILVGAIQKQPAVVDGEVVPRDQITITATVDHRFVDGYQLGTLAEAFRRVFEDPWSLGEVERPGRESESESADSMVSGCATS